MREVRRLAVLVSLGLTALLGACDGDDGGEAATECARGDTQPCTCDGGAAGTQVCGAYGTWAACTCQSPADVSDISEDAPEDTTPDVVILPDGAECHPDCEGKACGFDGCGGLCGTCGEESNCLDGQCMSCDASTCCAYPFGEKQDAKPIGAACEHDLECAYGECLLPGEDGNLTNDLFGFCTRGCDCNEREASRLTEDEEDVYECLVPPGSQGSLKHVVPKCSTVEDCEAVDPGWTGCALGLPGTAAKLCTALAEDTE
ncbi:MAG: hypothetical protein ACQEXJ_19530 [Myxococcota bacterium]